MFTRALAASAWVWLTLSVMAGTAAGVVGRAIPEAVALDLVASDSPSRTCDKSIAECLIADLPYLAVAFMLLAAAMIVTYVGGGVVGLMLVVGGVLAWVFREHVPSREYLVLVSGIGLVAACAGSACIAATGASLVMPTELN